MAWVWVGKSGNELLCSGKPTRYKESSWMMNPIYNDCVVIPKGSIKKLIGRELKWEDDCVELR